MNKIIIAISLISSLVSIPMAHACSVNSCDNQYEIVSSKLDRSRAVFIGKVTRIDRYENSKDIEFKVTKVYKGDLGETVTVNSESVGFEDAVCGYDFLEDEEYLVYAYGIVSVPGDVYFVEACGGARKLSCVTYEIGKLEKMIKISNNY